MPSAQQWREAAFALRQHAAKWEKLAEDQEDQDRALTRLLSRALRWREVHADGSLLDQTNAHHALIAAIDAWRADAPDSRCQCLTPNAAGHVPGCPLWEDKA